VIASEEIFGRDQELSRVRGFLAALAAGPRGLLLEGDPGIGKSTILSWAIVEATALSCQVLVCRPDERERVYCISRKRGMSVEEFSQYWRPVHGPIGRPLPGLRRLVQSHPVRHPDGIPPPDFDGMAELWFDDLESLQTARRSPEWSESTADEANFIDEARSAFFLTEEREIAT